MAMNRELGPVQPSEMYPLQAFKEVTGLGNRAMRSLRKAGLKVRRVSGRGFVLGSDFIQLLEEIGSLDDSGEACEAEA